MQQLNTKIANIESNQQDIIGKAVAAALDARVDGIKAALQSCPTPRISHRPQ